MLRTEGVRRLVLATLLTAVACSSSTAPKAIQARVVAAGNANACATRADSTALCWGVAAPGRLAAPWVVSTSLKFVALSSGTAFGCGLTETGAAWCWGADDQGQLGDGAATSSTTPVAVAGGHAFTRISSGGAHSCALTADGSAYCWGANQFGQLGVSGAAPVPVAIPNMHFISIAAGTNHSCGVAVGGTAYCWGQNISGQLGDGSVTDHTTPKAVVGNAVFASISAGLSVTCGVSTAHLAYCWGGGANMMGNGQANGARAPAQVSGEISFASVSVASSHVCALDADGAAWCWGTDYYGQLGVTASAAQPTPLRGAGTMRFLSISAGQYDYSDETHNPGTSGHTCGVATDNAVYCWGDNLVGQLGRPTPGQSSTPLVVP
jgi:alpha-tubulin suppressor-like RCC1 family protein